MKLGYFVALVMGLAATPMLTFGDCQASTNCGVNTQTGKTQCSSHSCAGSGTCLAEARSALVATTSKEALAAAFARAESEASGPMILNVDPRIEIGDFEQSGISISNVKVSLDSQQVSGVTYTIANNSGKTLLAYVSTLDYYWDIAPETPLRQTHTEDGWFITGKLLGSGEQDHAEVLGSLHPHQPVHLVKIVASLQFAEFADGTTWGTCDKSLAQKFTQTRQDKIAVFQQYGALLKTGLAKEDLAARIDADLQDRHIVGSKHTAPLQMQVALKNLGADLLASKLTETAMSLPSDATFVSQP